MTLPEQGQTIYGKQVSELIGEDVKVYADGTVTGTFLHVDGYSEFSSKKTEQIGNYFPFKLTKSGDTMTFIKNGTTSKRNIPWEADNVFRISSPTDTFEVLVDGESIVKFNFKSAMLKTE